MKNNILELKETPTKRTTPVVVKHTPFKEKLINKFLDRRVWILIATVSLLVNFIQPYLLISAYRQEERVVILDQAGTFHVSPLLTFEDSNKLHENAAITATLALLSRNPTGFDYPELLEKMYLPEAFNKAKENLKNESEDLMIKKIHQKVEVFRTDILQTRNNYVLVQVEGQLIRTGVFEGTSFTEPQLFKVQYYMARNIELTENGRFPLSVNDVNIEVFEPNTDNLIADKKERSAKNPHTEESNNKLEKINES